VRKRFVHRVAIVGLVSVGTCFALQWRHPSERLKIDERVIAAMHREQQFPFLVRAALRDDASHGMARGAGLFRVLVGGVLEVLLPPLDLERRGQRLFGCEAVMVGEIAENLARFGRLDLQLVEADHPLDRFFPPFRRRPAERDARQAAFVVLVMTGRALPFRGLVRHGNPALALLVGNALGDGARRRRRCGRRLLTVRRDDQEGNEGSGTQ